MLVDALLADMASFLVARLERSRRGCNRRVVRRNPRHCLKEILTSMDSLLRAATDLHGP